MANEAWRTPCSPTSLSSPSSSMFKSWTNAQALHTKNMIRIYRVGLYTFNTPRGQRRNARNDRANQIRCFLENRYEKWRIFLKKARHLLCFDSEAMPSTWISLDQIKIWSGDFFYLWNVCTYPIHNPRSHHIYFWEERVRIRGRTGTEDLASKYVCLPQQSFMQCKPISDRNKQDSRTCLIKGGSFQTQSCHKRERVRLEEKLC